MANGGTIFLDEVAELPMQTQVRLLRVLETGEFMRVGASKVIKTDVRVVAATNENMMDAITSGKFREDLYYRLSTVPIQLPALRDRKDDIHLLFRKFAHDFAEKYRMPAIKLVDESVTLLESNDWPGNIRQLKNLVEQLSVIETTREIGPLVLGNYLNEKRKSTGLVVRKNSAQNDFSERELMYKFLFDMKKDLSELKKLVVDILSKGANATLSDAQSDYVNQIYSEVANEIVPPNRTLPEANRTIEVKRSDYEEHQEVEESLSLEDREKELIKKALDKHRENENMQPKS